jgi:hypothetical protein
VKLIVSYTMTKTIDVEVEDYALTQYQISDLAELEANKVCPFDGDNLCWKWRREPKVLGSQQVPPAKFWFKTIKGLAATNGHILIFKNFPFPDNFVQESPWRILGENGKSVINKFLSENFDEIQNHSGWFMPAFRPLTEIPGLKVLGKGPTSPGYLVVNDELVGFVMPAAENYRGCFQLT